MMPSSPTGTGVMMSDAEYTEQMKIDDLEQARDNFAKMAYEQRKRAEASEARIAELELKYAEISEEHTRRVEEIADLRNRADRLAEAGPRVEA